MALVRLAHLADLVPLGQLAAVVAQMRSDPRAMANVAPSAASPSGLARPSLGGQAGGERPGEGVKKNHLTPAPDSATAPQGPFSIESWSEHWPQLLSKLGTMLGGQLARAGSPAITGPNALVFRFPASYNKEREYCQRPDGIARIERVLREVSGQDWKVTIETQLQPVAAPETVEPPRAARRSPKEEAQTVPLVKRALDVLGAAITRVDEGFGDDTRKRDGA
jgi:hypothetical protein